jgi:hypothetical protein
MKRIAFILAAALLMVPSVASLGHADTITYIETFEGSGYLGSSSNDFTNALVTITLVGNTSGVTLVVNTNGVFFVNIATSATVDIAGIGTQTFTDTMSVIDDQSGPALAIGAAPFELSIFYLPAFASYGLSTSLAQVNDSGSDSATVGSGPLTFATSGGDLLLTGPTVGSITTFQATVTPEPGSLALLMLGFSIIGVGAVIMKRKGFEYPLVR